MKSLRTVCWLSVAAILVSTSLLRAQDGPPVREVAGAPPAGESRGADRPRPHPEGRPESRPESRPEGRSEDRFERRAEVRVERERVGSPMRPPGGGEGEDRRGAVRRPERGADMREGGLPVRERLQHLKQAIQHLHAAGLHPVAERLTRELEENQRMLRERMERGANRARGPVRGGEFGPREGGPASDRAGVQEQIDDLRRELARMRRRLDEGGREPSGEGH